MNVRLKEIAKQANLSVATVSRALRGREEISQETRDSVQQIAEQLRYRPNELARGFIKGRSSIVGVLFPTGSLADFCMQMLAGIHSELGKLNLHPICIWTGDVEFNNDDLVASQIHSLVDRRVEGFIIDPAFDARETYIREIIERKIPTVTVDIDLLQTHGDFVGTDDFVGAYRATEHLLNLGHQHIACITGPRTSSTAVLRKKGFIEAISARQNIRSTVVEDPFFGTNLNTSYNLATQLLDATDRPTAIFCASDYIASSVYKAAYIKDIRIPQELSVIGFADIELARVIYPALTTVRQNPYLIGVTAAKILNSRILKDKNEGLQRVLLRPELIIRESASVPPL